MKHIKIPLVVLSVLFLGLSSYTYAVEIYALGQMINVREAESLSANAVIELPQAILYSIDPDTGTPTEIGPTGFRNCFGLDFEPGTRRALAVCLRLIMEDNGEFPIEEKVAMEEVGQVLIELDMQTGQGTEIGPLGLKLFSETGVTDISFRSDGTLFGIYSGPGNQQEEEAKELEFDEVTLLTIDTNTGQATEVGPTETGDAFGAIGFSLTGKLYHATDNIIAPGETNMLSDITGLGSRIADLVYPPNFDEKGITHFVSSLDYSAERGQLFGMLVSDRREPEKAVEAEQRIEFAPGSYLLILNPGTGVIELVGLTAEFGNQFAAMAVRGDFQRNVPTLSEYGLIATSIFLLLAAVFYLRRRNLQTEN